jgi:hypothetical protein
LILPQQIGQHITAKRYPWMQHEVDEQRPRRRSLELSDGFAILADLKCAEEGDFQSGHSREPRACDVLVTVVSYDGCVRVGELLTNYKAKAI